MSNDASNRPALDPAMLRQIAEAVRRVRFGSVEIIIQDGKVVQIDTTEKRRIDPQR